MAPVLLVVMLAGSTLYVSLTFSDGENVTEQTQLVRSMTHCRPVVTNPASVIDWWIFETLPVHPENNRKIMSPIHYGYLLFSFASVSLFALSYPIQTYFFQRNR